MTPSPKCHRVYVEEITCERCIRSWLLSKAKKELEKEEKTVIPFPDKKYDIIYADPPWSYSDKGCNGNAADHYPTMTVEEICKLPVNVAGGIASDNCILFMWATYPMMKEALKVIEAWGFTYKSIAFQWVKTKPQRKRLLFRTRPLDKGETRSLAFWL